MLKSLSSGLSFTRINERHAAALIAGLLGLFFIAGVGFASPQAIHDAAHDTRHALTFPCH